MPEKKHPIRLLRRDGELNLHKDVFNTSRVYAFILEISWQRFLLFTLLSYVSINLIFTILYLLAGGRDCLVKSTVDAHFSLLDVYFFSTQTFTTVGYGQIYPSCIGTNTIAAVESFSGLVFFAVATGLFFAKFTKPRVEIRLSDVAVFDHFLDGFALKFMLANEYQNKLVDVEVTLDLIRLEVVEGRYKKRFYHCDLLRDKIPFLAVPWTVVHRIDKNSPLYGISRAEFENSSIELFVQVKSYDEAHRQVLFKEFSYFGTEEILWGHKFVNIQRYTEEGALKLSMGRFGKTTKVEDFPEQIPPPQYAD